MAFSKALAKHEGRYFTKSHTRQGNWYALKTRYDGQLWSEFHENLDDDGHDDKRARVA